MSSSIAATCSATLASSAVRGFGDGSVDAEETIEVPLVEERKRRGIANLRSRETPDVGELLQRSCSCAGSRWPNHRFSVDEEMALIVEQLGARVQGEPACRYCAPERTSPQRLRRRIEMHARLRLGQIDAEKLLHYVLIPTKAAQHADRALAHRGADACGLVRGSKVTVCITSRNRNPVAQPVEEGNDQFLRRGRAKADRVGGAGVQRGALMRDVRREIKHVSGGENVRLPRAEAGKDLERQFGLKRQVALTADAPATSAGPLEQKNIVRIDVRSHSAARRGEAHHQIVESRVRDEVETAKQCFASGNVQVDSLDEQSPFVPREGAPN